MANRPLVERAAQLATDLLSRVSRRQGLSNLLLSVVADFQTTGDLDRLRRTLTLLQAGNGGHLERGKTYVEQMNTVIAELEALLAEGRSAAELKSLFGWTARLLVARQGQGGGEGRAEARTVAKKREPEKRERSTGPGRLGLGGKNLDVLQRLKDGGGTK